jgi:hypothetical protein
LHGEELSPGAQKAAAQCENFLRNAPYRSQGDYEICDDSDGLKQQSSTLFWRITAAGQGITLQRTSLYLFTSLQVFADASKDRAEAMSYKNPKPRRS